MKTRISFLAFVWAMLSAEASLQAELPGAGFPVAAITDDFEAGNWSFNLATNLSNQSGLDSVNGWMSLGINWDADGRTHYFVHFGTADFIAESEVGITNDTLVSSPRRMNEMAYHFISLGHPNTNQGSEVLTPDFIVDDFTVSTVRPIGAAIAGDKDGDGLSNGLEYAFGLDPASPTPASSIPEILLSGNALTTSYTVPSGVTGVTYGAESSEDLATWTAILNTGTGSNKIFSVSTSGKPRLFLRHKVINKTQQ